MTCRYTMLYAGVINHQTALCMRETDIMPQDRMPTWQDIGRFPPDLFHFLSNLFQAISIRHVFTYSMFFWQFSVFHMHVFCLLPAWTHCKIDKTSSQYVFSKPNVARLPVSISHLLPTLRDTSVISRLRSTTSYLRPTSRTKSTNVLRSPHLQTVCNFRPVNVFPFQFFVLFAFCNFQLFCYCVR